MLVAAPRVLADEAARRAWGMAMAALLAAFLSGGCATVLPTGPPLPRDLQERSTPIAVHGGRLSLHLASQQTPASASLPLVLYASGDGGWFGAAVGMFHTIAASGYPTVGFSSKELMHLEHRQFKPLGVAQVAEAYQQIIVAARAAFRLPPDTPVVVTGWSRGAALGALVAGRIDSSAHVVGLVAIGLAAEEDLEIESDTDDEVDPRVPLAPVPAHGARAGSIALYPLLPTLAPQRVVVLQASGDTYLPAPRARALFGADTVTTRLVEIDAHNHRFGGGEARFAAALVEAVAWVAAGAAPDARTTRHSAKQTLHLEARGTSRAATKDDEPGRLPEVPPACDRSATALTSRRAGSRRALPASTGRTRPGCC